MLTSSKKEESPPPASKEPEDDPLVASPKDPPESTHERRTEFGYEISFNNSSAKDAMLITPKKVEFIASPPMLYKIICTVNHFIKHIITHYSDIEGVSTKSL